MSKEQLEWAAKACGLTIYWYRNRSYSREECELGRDDWNPLTDEADSARMAGVLEIAIRWSDNRVYANRARKNLPLYDAYVSHDNTIEGKCAAVREARMAVAVEIGRAK
jgi:hypothetical protein